MYDKAGVKLAYAFEIYGPPEVLNDLHERYDAEQKEIKEEEKGGGKPPHQDDQENDGEKDSGSEKKDSSADDSGEDSDTDESEGNQNTGTASSGSSFSFSEEGRRENTRSFRYGLDGEETSFLKLRRRSRKGEEGAMCMHQFNRIF